MKLALVHDFFTQWGGGERVLQTFSDVWPDAPIYLIAKYDSLVEEFLSGRKVTASFLQSWPGMPKAFKYYISFMPRAIESFDLREYDVVLSDCSTYAKGCITRPNQPHICYLHTPTRYLTSDTEEYLASAPIPLPAVGTPIVRMLLKRLKKWDLMAAQRPTVLIVNSEYIAERTRKYYGRSPDHVIWPPVDTSKFPLSEAPGQYWLTLGRAEPYKRTDLAILAANKLGVPLKVVGGGTRIEELKAIAGPTVEFMGRVTDEELVKLYGGAIALLFPPKEDAGMTPLEAMSSGRPVLAFGEGGALESVAAGRTGEFFAEQTVDCLAEAMRAFRPENYSPGDIRAHALQFDTKVFQSKIRAIIEEAAASCSVPASRAF